MDIDFGFVSLKLEVSVRHLNIEVKATTIYANLELIKEIRLEIHIESRWPKQMRPVWEDRTE